MKRYLVPAAGLLLVLVGTRREILGCADTDKGPLRPLQLRRPASIPTVQP